ncbi:hypothetical protein [Desulfovibrio cuneatus]|uniref:hypothetical protein n=1 Tax=Desulfovibrio cuneatus TaxID=159728 RepID=UPI0004199C26|nr:hypothetical protein [Desulfovibrio cuneatus]
MPHKNSAVLDALLNMIIAKRWDYSTPITCPPGHTTCPGGDEAKCHACWKKAAEDKAGRVA